MAGTGYGIGYGIGYQGASATPSIPAVLGGGGHDQGGDWRGDYFYNLRRQGREQEQAIDVEKRPTELQKPVISQLSTYDFVDIADAASIIYSQKLAQALVGTDNLLLAYQAREQAEREYRDYLDKFRIDFVLKNNAALALLLLLD